MKDLWKMGLAGALVAFAISGCAGDDKPFAPNLRPVNGDPWVYVKNTDNNGETGSLPKELFAGHDGERWEMSYYGFREQKLYGYQKSREHFLDGSRRLPPFSEQEDSNKGIILKGKYTGTLLTFNENNDGRLVIKGGDDILFHGETQKVVHYSYTPDMRSFSILFYMTSESGLKALISISATKVDDKGPSVDDNNNEKYNYLSPSGKLMRWDQNQTVTFNKCFIPFDGLEKIIDSSFKAWQPALTGRLTSEIDKKTLCPPFSDLNTHTIQYIDDWVEVNGPGGVMGGVWPGYFETSGRIVDADMFIYKAEISDMLQALRPGTNINDPSTYEQEDVKLYFGWVITHEFGHMYGLDHKMEGPMSIMSYDRNYFRGEIFSYDRDAIHNLYPLKDNLSLKN